MSLFLGIDTSNYTTSAAVYNSETGEMKKLQKLLPVKKGQLGLRQSDAVFHHTRQLHTLLSELLCDTDTSKISSVGASVRPRPAEGSYMPCFCVGESTAEVISSVLKIPLFRFSHQEGHISAALFSARRDDLFDGKFLAFHVSGGTTEAVLAEGCDSGFSIEPVAKSLDLNAGQAIDRTGVMLGLEFPCGARIEELALKYTGKISVSPSLKGADCCLSGLQNQCDRLISEGRGREYVAAYCIQYIGKTIELMTERLSALYGNIPVVYAGGVMSDGIIKNSLSEKFNAVFAQPSFSSDNAAGIAYLAYRRSRKCTLPK